ncbi:glycosyltransferase family 4 protein [Candidatus Sumerlaeota bacterium]|nr:glycosyltransferase family 4 protein [Candidatus Sumerlaeota bacterium]
MPVRVLQVTAVDFTVEKLLLPLIRFLEAKGCEVTTACARGEHWEGLEAQGVRLVEIPFRRSSVDLLAHRRAGRALLRHLRAERYDVVHTHTPVASLIGRWAAWKARVPVILYTAHGFFFHDLMRPWLRRVHVHLERWGARRHHHLLTQSEEDRQSAIGERIAAPSEVTWIGNGVDTDRFTPGRFSAETLAAKRSELGLRPDSPVVVHVARLVPHKGAHELVEAAAIVHREMPEAQFLIIGSALRSDRHDYEGVLRALIAERDLRDTVIMAGPRPEIPEILALSSIFALPTTFEGVPRSGIEAMASGLPCVMNAIRGCREEVIEGETGHLIPIHDPGAMADRLLRLLRDPALARRMGEAGRARACELFDERLVLEREWRVICALLAQRGIEVNGGGGAP